MENHIELETSSKRDKGFTLVELLIVIVILGILATVTVFAVRGITDKGKESACAADRKTLETAIEAYYAYSNVYPVQGANQAASIVVLEGLLVPDYTKTVPANFRYEYVALAPTFALVGTGTCQ